MFPRLFTLTICILYWALSAPLFARPQRPVVPQSFAELQTLLRPYIDRKDWDRTVEEALKYEAVFQSDSDYQSLLRTLRRPSDSTLVAIPLRLVNTEGDEYGPVLSADGQTLYFCGRARRDNYEGEDVYVSHWDQRRADWGQPVLLSSLSSRYNDAPMSVSMDGNTMLIFSRGQIFASVKSVQGWSTPWSLPSDFRISPWQADAMMTPDGKAFLFAADCPTSRESKPSLNIFLCELHEDGSIGRPIDLGPQINTSLDERAPILHPDMKTLYFCSSGHGSLGGMDIYMTTRLRDDSWTEWSEPVNLGKDINTSGNDCWFRISTDGKEAYFSRAVYGRMQDIYRMPLPDFVRPNPVITLCGYVTDEEGQPLSTDIRWEDLTLNRPLGAVSVDAATGWYFMALPLGHNYGYYIDHQDFFPLAMSVDLTSETQPRTIQRDIQLRSISRLVQEQTPTRLNNLFFATASAQLQPESYPELNRLVELLQSRKDLFVTIVGHTDNVGDNDSNRQLSEERAASVRQYLIAHGCSASRIRTVGYGESHPEADNTTEEGRAMNRRVEIVFSK